jgi:hypothetical protein
LYVVVVLRSRKTLNSYTLLTFSCFKNTAVKYMHWTKKYQRAITVISPNRVIVLVHCTSWHCP